MIDRSGIVHQLPPNLKQPQCLPSKILFKPYRKHTISIVKKDAWGDRVNIIYLTSFDMFWLK